MASWAHTSADEAVAASQVAGRHENKDIVEAGLEPDAPHPSLKTAWKNVKDRADVTGRFHDTRHTLITELAESGAGDETIMAIAGHVSRQMLARYSHIRMEAKRRALDAVEMREVPVEASAPDEVVINRGHKTGHNLPRSLKPRSVNN